MSAKYLCCLPLRLGVLIMSFLQFFSTGAVTAFLVYILVELGPDGRFTLHDNKGNTETFTVHLSSRTKIVVIVVTVLYGLVALISLTGFIGAIRKKETYVAIYANLQKMFLSLQCCFVTAYIILLFVDKDKVKNVCIGGSTNQAVIDACNSPSKHVWVLVLSALLPIVFQAYGVYVISSYVQKLHNEKFLHQESFGFKGPNYVPVTEETYPLTHNAPYPYTDNSHSFGHV
ncbi:hypothetical protein DFH06DRAFT_201735 [Mycena polygramma]|nr:hypothetical protein DFH06DRAFT_201735 [Mycena polygramma]